MNWLTETLHDSYTNEVDIWKMQVTEEKISTWYMVTKNGFSYGAFKYLKDARPFAKNISRRYDDNKTTIQ